MISRHARDFERNLKSTWVPGAQILGEHKELIVPVTGISKPVSTREYPGNW